MAEKKETQRGRVNKAGEQKDGGKYRKLGRVRAGKRIGGQGDEDKERKIPKPNGVPLAPRKIGLWSPLTISKLRATLPTYPA